MKNFVHIPAISECTEEDKECWAGEEGLITHVIERNMTDVSDFEAYMCGPPIMLEKTTELLVKMGINKDRVYFDEF